MVSFVKYVTHSIYQLRSTKSTPTITKKGKEKKMTLVPNRWQQQANNHFEALDKHIEEQRQEIVRLRSSMQKCIDMMDGDNVDFSINPTKMLDMVILELRNGLK